MGERQPHDIGAEAGPRSCVAPRGTDAFAAVERLRSLEAGPRAAKQDGLRRGLASEEERHFPLRALEALAGARNVNAVAAVRDLL